MLHTCVRVHIKGLLCWYNLALHSSNWKTHPASLTIAPNPSTYLTSKPCQTDVGSRQTLVLSNIYQCLSWVTQTENYTKMRHIISITRLPICLLGSMITFANGLMKQNLAIAPDHDESEYQQSDESDSIFVGVTTWLAFLDHDMIINTTFAAMIPDVGNSYWNRDYLPNDSDLSAQSLNTLWTYLFPGLCTNI